MFYIMSENHVPYRDVMSMPVSRRYRLAMHINDINEERIRGK